LLDQEPNALFVMEGQKRYQKIPSSKDVEACPFAARGTPVTLWWAAFYGHYDVIRLLIESREVGPLISLENAVQLGNAAAVNLILGMKKEEVRTEGKIGVPELIWWVKNGHETLLSIDDVDVNSEDGSGYTALLHAVNLGQGRIVKLFLDREDINVNWQDGRGCTVLHHAAKRGQDRIVKLILDREDITVNLQDGRGCTALHHAALNGDDLIPKRLLDMEDIDIGIKTASGDTALSYALDDLRGFDIFGSRKRIVKLLLDADKQCRHFDINERRRALVFCQGTRS
jgi:ankyrin repeat protein